MVRTLLPCTLNQPVNAHVAEIESSLLISSIRDLVLIADDKELTAALLEERYRLTSGESWPQHQTYDFESWANAASQCETKVGYWEWVVHELEAPITEKPRHFGWGFFLIDLSDENIFFKF